ncbi:MAG: hypothetical protein AAGA48_25770 [Myxococcota bacterium]
MSQSPESQLVNDPDGYWKVDNLSALPPFLIHVVSSDDHWVFLSSSGGLTAGRRKAQRSLFPYETDDRLHHAAGVSGGVTWIRTADGQLWHPLDARGTPDGYQRTLRKALTGDWVELEETAPDLGLVFTVRFTTSPRYGLVRQARLTRTSGSGSVEIMDGLLNLLPAEVPLSAQQTLSALVDAYKRSEVDAETTLALYVMEAQLSDRAAPAESLRANVVWRTGLPNGVVALDERALDAFRAGRPTPPVSRSLGMRGAYLVRATVDPGAEPVEWSIVGDVHFDQAAVVELDGRLRDPAGLAKDLAEDIERGHRALLGLVAASDGQQVSAAPRATVNHFSNVVYNIMRGGVFGRDHEVPADDFARFVQQRNRQLFARHQAWLAERTGLVPHRDLLNAAAEVGDPQLERLCLEYLPLTFSRRHGDPSRPWNAFNIVLTHDDGTPCYDYEGNWRDIFQNWEALARSFPDFYGAIVAKFVNASTVDGFNPYRLTRDGVDWEAPDPDDPWSNIGYWGDHQVVYLFRLIEAAEAHRPGCIREWLGRDLFSYADVPYRIRPYADLVADAKDTIEFDEAADARAQAQSAAWGSDGRLVLDQGQVKQVNLTEKLLVSLLAKMSNFVVDGGIWLNTQRPEWNDANNALVGQGLSMVTLAQLRKAFTGLGALLDGAGAAFPVSGEVVQWLEAVLAALTRHAPPAVPAPIADGVRRQILDQLGEAFSAYRSTVYERGLGERVSLATDRIAELCRVSQGWIDHTLRTNRREDGLYHSYNRLAWTPDGVRVARLSEMLEGQVAVLGCGLLSGAEACDLVDALYRSALYRKDQHTFILYPNRERPDFLKRNQLDASVVAATPLLTALAADPKIGPQVLAQDAHGTYRWHADFQNASMLDKVLERIAKDPAWSTPIQAGRAATLEAYEATFDHHAFTGRSGTMHKYEGLGSVYWHMVGKLLVSVQEAWQLAVDGGEDSAIVRRLAAAYDRVRAGLPFNKSVAEYGAIPTDPYSHTPWHLGAQQPGMTGQVKEEVLTRLGELGLRVRDGAIEVHPGLLRRDELATSPMSWTITGYRGAQQTIEVPTGALGFTVAQVPFVLATHEGSPEVHVTYTDGRTEQRPGRSLGQQATNAVFARRGLVERVTVRVPLADVRPVGPMENA